MIVVLVMALTGHFMLAVKGIGWFIVGWLVLLLLYLVCLGIWEWFVDLIDISDETAMKNELKHRKQLGYDE
ncbi:MAG TPA: hypothetical protein PKK10_11675 [Woeseiaceae bacterium]|nr:hypothetical protein [Woeseiaceae bacterium]